MCGEEIIPAHTTDKIAGEDSPNEIVEILVRRQQPLNVAVQIHEGDVVGGGQHVLCNESCGLDFSVILCTGGDKTKQNECANDA